MYPYAVLFDELLPAADFAVFSIHSVCCGSDSDEYPKPKVLFSVLQTPFDKHPIVLPFAFPHQQGSQTASKLHVLLSIHQFDDGDAVFQPALPKVKLPPVHDRQLRL